VIDDPEPGTEATETRTGAPGPVADPGDGDRGRDEDVTDALPDDLDVSAYVGPYVFPNNNRRKVPAYLYLGFSVLSAAIWVTGRNGDNALVNAGLLWAALGLAVMGAYSFVAAWDLDVDEQDALVIATRTVGFPVGHASAQLGWRGLRSRPTWRLLLYSAENPPETRGLALVDGVSGEVVDWFVEANPEDWSDLAGGLTGDRSGA
jgi:hypothetical protein